MRLRKSSPALAALALLSLLAGCAAPAQQPGEEVGPPTPSALPGIRYGCWPGAAAVHDGVCGLALTSATGERQVQDLAASPVDNKTYVLALYANDLAETPGATAQQSAAAAWTSWLLVTRDGGATWQRRDLPALAVPGLPSGFGKLAIRDLEFAPGGALHLAVAVERNDPTLSGLIPLSTPDMGAQAIVLFHLASPDHGATWGPATLLGPLGDLRKADLGVWSDGAWAVFWDGSDGLRYSGTRDGGQGWQAGEASPDRCNGMPKASRVRAGVLVSCRVGDSATLYEWSASDGSVQVRSALAVPSGSFENEQSLGTDGDLEATYSVGGEDPWLAFSHDGGATWSRPVSTLQGAQLGADWENARLIRTVHPAYDDAGNVHLLLTAYRFRDDVTFELDFRFLHLVREPWPEGKVLATKLGAPASGTDWDLRHPPRGIGVMPPSENLGLHGQEGVAILSTGNWVAVSGFSLGAGQPAAS